ncbi:hypothetical protein M422DRAFT_89719, partial [Sphaerobolus stellatus SS14]
KPSQKVQDILDGKGHTSAKPADLKLPPGVQPPSVELEELKRQKTQVLEGEGMSDWMMVGDWIEEYAMAAEISEVEVLELCSLGEAKVWPDWPLWEQAIKEELVTLKEAGTWELLD